MLSPRLRRPVTQHRASSDDVSGHLEFKTQRQVYPWFVGVLTIGLAAGAAFSGNWYIASGAVLGGVRALWRVLFSPDG
jgi:hypothetical protein